MKNFSLSIYGNLILDQVLSLDSFPSEGFASKIAKIYFVPGASANIARAYHSITGNKASIYSCVGKDFSGEKILESISEYSNCNVKKVDGETSTAVILANETKATRTGLVKWGVCSEMNNFPNCDSQWKHFSYIDKLHNLTPEILSSLSGIKSVDFTSFDYNDIDRERIIGCLSEIDYVISSTEESCFLTKADHVDDAVRMLGEYCKGYAIIHEKSGSYVSDGSSCVYVNCDHEILENISVLGAGDIFAASFISSFKEELTIEEIAILSHQKTFKLLGEIND
tara:strand:- start:1167 stop:2012 length:846 start_codon:yes stop_codon:yes gene_type:complete